MNTRPRDLGTSVYDRLKSDIIHGILRPGSELALDPLKLQYDTSIPTLRASLSRLSREGFVRGDAQQGFFVSDVSAEELREIAEVRVLLECAALRASVTYGDTEWERNLVSAHHRLNLTEQRLLAGDAREKETWKRHDFEFHLALIRNCHSQNLLALHGTLYDKYLRYQMLMLTYRGETAVDEHRSIFQSALARDGVLAAEYLKRHILRGVDHALEAMRLEEV